MHIDWLQERKGVIDFKVLVSCVPPILSTRWLESLKHKYMQNTHFTGWL